MGAQLNIKSEDAYRLATRLSELTGESLTSVVTKALQAELERSSERTRDREERLRRVREITADMRRQLRHRLPSSIRLAVRRKTACHDDRRQFRPAG